MFAERICRSIYRSAFYTRIETDKTPAFPIGFRLCILIWISNAHLLMPSRFPGEECLCQSPDAVLYACATAATVPLPQQLAFLTHGARSQKTQIKDEARCDQPCLAFDRVVNCRPVFNVSQEFGFQNASERCPSNASQSRGYQTRHYES